MSRIKNILLATIAMMEVAQSGKSPFSSESQTSVSYNPDYKVKQPHQKLKEFCVKGKRIYAYSKKDAIKRLKHFKKI